MLQIQSAGVSTISSDRFFITSNNTSLDDYPTDKKNTGPIVVTVVTWLCLAITILSIIALGYYGYRAIRRKYYAQDLERNVTASNRGSNMDTIERAERDSDRADAEFVRIIRQFSFGRPGRL
jgi:hypothetical protein